VANKAIDEEPARTTSTSGFQRYGAGYRRAGANGPTRAAKRIKATHAKWTTDAGNPPNL